MRFHSKQAFGAAVVPVVAIILVAAAGIALGQSPANSWAGTRPRGFPTLRVPADNPMTSEKVTLGRHLFYDPRLSDNGRQSCATCHQQARAFTDGRARAIGSTGELHPRSTMSLANVGYAGTLTWNNPTLTRLEDQALVPLFGKHPVEMGLTRPGDALLARLRPVETYQRLFAAAFGEGDVITVANVTRALAAFERTFISGSSPYDRYRFGRDPGALSPAAKRASSCFSASRYRASGATRDLRFRVPRTSRDDKSIWRSIRTTD